MSAAPTLPARQPDSTDETRIIAFPGTELSVAEAASVLGVAESTLRRHLKRGSEEQGSETQVEGDYRGRPFVATRNGPRTPWKVKFTPAVQDPSSHYDDLKVAMLPISQERALEHTPQRPWWKFWSRH